MNIWDIGYFIFGVCLGGLLAHHYFNTRPKVLVNDDSNHLGDPNEIPPYVWGILGKNSKKKIGKL